MENKERQILAEIMDMMTSVRSQLELLDAKMAELQQIVGQGDADMAPIDLDIDDMPEDYASPVVVPEEPIEAVEEPSADPEPVEEVLSDPVDDLPDDDLPFYEIPETSVEKPLLVEEAVLVEEPVLVDKPVASVEQKPVVAVIDSMTDRQAWRTDMPGSQVKDIRSAISLNDRILFINNLFGEDPLAFQDSLTKINQMESLDEVVGYLLSAHPDWDFEAETVYRFMMAVRRKIR